MITLLKDKFVVPGVWTFRAKSAPDRKYDPNKRVWLIPNNLPNRKHLINNFLQNEFDPAALVAVNTAPEPAVITELGPCPDWTRYNNPAKPEEDLLPHQIEGLTLAWGNASFFFAHDMGSGKSRSTLTLWDAYFQAGVIDEAWVICPNALIDNWIEQIEKWTPQNRAKIKVYGVLSLSQGSLPAKLVKESHPRLAVAVDESQRIKNSQAKRTKVMHEVGKNAGFRLNLTGTNITKGIEDLYSQYNFLDPDILGFKSFYSFRNRYCIMGGYENKQIVAYQNINELMDAIRPYTHQVKDPVKLPKQTPEIRHIEVAPEQKRLLSELKAQMSTEMAGNRLSVQNVLSYYTRGAQILGGFFPLPDGRNVRMPTNNKMDELIEIVRSTDLKIVIFCRYVPEANMIIEQLRDMGIGVRQIKAKDPNLQREVTEFRTDPDVQCIVSTYDMGSLGFTLVEGKVLVEYSGTFNFEHSVQARKRIHRIGQEDETKVIRLLARSKLDHAIKGIADRKQDIADFVTASLNNPRALLDLLD